MRLLLHLKIVDDAHERAHDHLDAGWCLRPILVRKA